MVGYTTALTAIAAMQSRDSGGPVDIDPAWYTFDFEVPSFYEYDPSWSTKKCEAPKCPCCGKPLPKKPVIPCSECGQPLPPVKPGEQAVPLRADLAGRLGETVAGQIDQIAAFFDAEKVEVLRPPRRLRDEGEAGMVGERVDRRRLAGVGATGKCNLAQ